MDEASRIAAKLSAAQKHEWLKQERDWPLILKGAQGGNPYATLCQHCFGRHEPPRDNICPHQTNKGGPASMALPAELRVRDLGLAVRQYLMEAGK